MFLNRLRVAQKSVANPVDICRCTPRMNAFCALNLMRRRAVPTVGGDEHGRAYFMAKILQQSRKYNNCAGHIMGKLAQQRPRFTAIDQHQFGEREVRRQAKFLRFRPAANFVKETWQPMDVA